MGAGTLRETRESGEVGFPRLRELREAEKNNDMVKTPGGRIRQGKGDTGVRSMGSGKFRRPPVPLPLISALHNMPVSFNISAQCTECS